MTTSKGALLYDTVQFRVGFVGQFVFVNVSI